MNSSSDLNKQGKLIGFLKVRIQENPDDSKFYGEDGTKGVEDDQWNIKNNIPIHEKNLFPQTDIWL